MYCISVEFLKKTRKMLRLVEAFYLAEKVSTNFRDCSYYNKHYLLSVQALVPKTILSNFCERIVALGS